MAVLSTARRSNRFWWWAIGGLCVVGLGIRLASVYVDPNKAPGGDAFFYHVIANQLANGIFWEHGPHYFAGPPTYYSPHPSPTAFYAPLFPAVLSVASVVGAKSFLAARVWCCVIGTAAVPLAALLGRQVANRRVGFIAALLAATYPNLWMSDGLVLSEALTPVLVLLVLLAAYHFWRRPSWCAAALLGAAIAAAALNHDELALLVVFILVPLVLLARVPLRRRAAWLGCGLAAAAIVVGPWVGWNLTRFSKPVFISDNLGFTLSTGNCPLTWNGPNTGYWSIHCLDIPRLNPHADESAQTAEAESTAIHYIDHHLSSLPRVTAAKIGRGFGLYRPIQQITFDHQVETRPFLWAKVGLGMYYALGVLSIAGAFVLRRRRVPIFPLLAIGLDVVLAMAIGFGQTRYRTAFEVSLIILAAVEIDVLVSHLRRRWSGRQAAMPETATREPVPTA
jgi:4-amino-4-deoxy-L-arabinose transferase-like glycosyltransferase